MDCMKNLKLISQCKTKEYQFVMLVNYFYVTICARLWSTDIVCGGSDSQLAAGKCISLTDTARMCCFIIVQVLYFMKHA